MRPFLVILLMAGSVHAQSVADAARKERERRAHLKAVEVIRAESPSPTAPAAQPAKSEQGAKGDEAAKSGEPAKAEQPAKAEDATKAVEKPKTEEKAKPEEPKKPALDLVKEYNDQLDKLRAKMRSLQDEESATQLQINQLNNQVYAPVVDQATKDQAQAAVGAAQQKLAGVRMELDQTRRDLEALQRQGPPKK